MTLFVTQTPGTGLTEVEATTGVGKKKRLMIVAHSAFQGGAELCLDTLLRQFVRDKYLVTVLFPWEGPMAQSARDLGYEVEIRHQVWWMGWGFSLWYFKTLLLRILPDVVALARYIKQRNFDLVYSNSAFIFEAALAARLAGVPHVWHVHEVLRPGNVTASLLPLRLVKWLIHRLSRRVVFESNASRAVYEGGKPDGRATVVYNPVRFLHEPPADLGSFRKQLHLCDTDRVVSFIGQFSERKNPLLLVRAAARLSDRNGWRFLFVGDGPLRAELLRAIDESGLRECCQVLPFQQDVTGVLSATDVLVLPSRQESFGLVLVEAAAYGKPVIATRTEGPSEIVVDGVTGFLIPPEDDVELARRLADVFGPDVNRQQMGEAAARRARELFSATEYASRVEQIINDAMGSGRGRVADEARSVCLTSND
jgi:glycosyltransferase involved in cell wall biosynthesis